MQELQRAPDGKANKKSVRNKTQLTDGITKRYRCTWLLQKSNNKKALPDNPFLDEPHYEEESTNSIGEELPRKNWIE